MSLRDFLPLDVTSNAEPRGFWSDPEWRNRDKDCKEPGCQGTGFLRKVTGSNELPCPTCRPRAATEAQTNQFRIGSRVQPKPGDWVS
jgi:hypothetical protein